MPINTPVEQQIVSSTSKALAVNRGKAAMLVADLDKGTIVLMDGKTYGGIPAAREDVQIRAGSGAITVNGKEWSTLTGTINIDIKPEGFIENAVSPSDKVLGVGDDGKIAAQLSVGYDVDTGLFSLKGKDGAVISSFNLVIPTGITPKSIALVQNPETQAPGLYLEFTFVDDDDVEIKLYANMDALKDVYTAGRGIVISDDRVISVDGATISGVIADDLIGDGGGLKVGDDGKIQVAVDPNGVIGINENGLHLQFDGGLQSTVMPDGEHVLELGSHASETPEYGLGDETHYGHVKLSDEADATATEAAGIAATPSAVKAVDNAAVHKTGDEVISGVKTFEDVPLIKQADGSTDQVATIGDAQMLVDGTIWGKRIETDLPEDTSQLTADMPVGAFLVTPGGGSGSADTSKWGIALDEAPTEDNFATVTADVPNGGFYSVPATQVALGPMLNTEVWITESGTWIAPVTGWYDILTIDGGCGGWANSTNLHARGGESGAYKHFYAYFLAGDSIPVTIGSAGQGLISDYNNPSAAGGKTSFGELEASWQDTCFIGVDIELPTSNGAIYACGAGFGGGRPLQDTEQSAGRFYGAGGGCCVIGTNKWSGNGAPGAVRLRYYDPSK